MHCRRSRMWRWPRNRRTTQPTGETTNFFFRGRRRASWFSGFSCSSETNYNFRLGSNLPAKRVSSASPEIYFDDVAFYIAKGPGIGTSVDGISIPGLALLLPSHPGTSGKGQQGLLRPINDVILCDFM